MRRKLHEHLNTKKTNKKRQYTERMQMQWKTHEYLNSKTGYNHKWLIHSFIHWLSQATNHQETTVQLQTLSHRSLIQSLSQSPSDKGVTCTHSLIHPLVHWLIRSVNLINHWEITFLLMFTHSETTVRCMHTFFSYCRVQPVGNLSK